jgi:ADP-ribosylglycohydrolase
MKAETKYKGSIKLSAIGDALGWITEFEKSQDSLRKKYQVDRVDKFYSWEKNVGGRFNGYKDKIAAGSYSDDTQLMLAVARSIKKDGGVDETYFSKSELSNWLMYSRGAGRTVKNAARKITRKSARWNKNFFSYKIGKNNIDYRDTGANGAAMRILPIALANLGEVEKMKEQVFGNSIVTHGHPRAIVGAMLYGYAIDLMLQHRPDFFDFGGYLTEIGKDIHFKLAPNFLDKIEYSQWVAEWDKNSNISFKNLFQDTLDETQEYLRIVYKGITKPKTDKEVLTELGCYADSTKGSGISTVIAGIYFVSRYYKEPITAIEKPVNALGTDTDSVAAFTGGLIGALHGQNVIPEKWKSIQDHDYLEKVALDLLAISEDRPKEEETIIEPERLKTITNDITDRFDIKDRVYFEPLGNGTVVNIDRQKTLTKGQYNLLLEVDFDIGQSCKIAKLLKDKENV